MVEMRAYAELKELSRDEVDEMLGFVRMLDQVFLDDTAQRMKREQKKHGGTRSPNRRSRSPNRR